MNIALIAYDFYPSTGGVAHVLNSFCKSFKRKDHNLYVFTRFFRGRNIYNVLDKKEYNLRDFIFLLKKKRFLYFLILTIEKLLKDKKVTFSDKLVIILYMILRLKNFTKVLQSIQTLYPYFQKHNIQVILGGSSGLHTASISFFLSRIFNNKVICLAYGNDFLVRTRLSLKSYIFKYLDLIILGTQSMKNLFLKVHHLKEEKTKVINYGLILKEYEIEGSKEKLRSEFGISKNQFVLLSVGRHVSRKKFDYVIKAVKKIKEFDPNINIKYFLLGQGEFTPELKKLTKNLALEENVKFLGYVDTSMRNKFYKLSDIFLMPSIMEKESIEGFGLVFLEANYFYTPVIGAYSGGIVEAIENGKSGLLVKPNDVDDLVEKILYLYNNPSIRYEIGKNGHNRVMSKFNWEKLIEDYVNTFVDVAK